MRLPFFMAIGLWAMARDGRGNCAPPFCRYAYSCAEIVVLLTAARGDFTNLL